MPRETRRRSAKFLWQSLQSAELLKRSSCSALLSGIKPPTRSKLNVMERREPPVRRMAKDCSFRIRRPSKEKNCNLVHARKINRKVCSISFLNIGTWLDKRGVGLYTKNKSLCSFESNSSRNVVLHFSSNRLDLIDHLNFGIVTKRAFTMRCGKFLNAQHLLLCEEIDRGGRTITFKRSES